MAGGVAAVGGWVLVPSLIAFCGGVISGGVCRSAVKSRNGCSGNFGVEVLPDERPFVAAVLVVVSVVGFGSTAAAR